MAGRSFTVGIRIAAEDRTSATIAKIQGSTRGLESGLRSLGVTLDKDANKKLELNRVLLDEAAKAYARGAITIGDYRRAQEKVAAQNTRISATMQGATSGAAAAGGAFGRLSTSLNAFALRSAAALIGLSALTRGLRAAVTGALDQEAAEKKRAIALERAGGSSAAMVASLDAQAAALQRTTKVSDDAVIGLQAYLLELGVTADRTAEATQVTVDFAERFGLSLPKAAKAVAGILRGELTPGISRLIPELKNLKEAGLLSAEGFDFLAASMRGAAKAAGETRAGGLVGLKNDLGELGEAFVDGATKTEGFSSSLTATRENLQSITPAFQLFGTVVSATLGGIVAIAKGVGTAIGVMVSQLDQMRPRMAAFEASNFALGATAERLGITVEQLKARLEAAGTATVHLVDASTKAEVGTAALGSTVEITAEQLRKMEVAAAGAGSATDELAQKLGIVTTVQIAQQIFEISFALEKVRLESSLTSAEFVKLEEIAGAKIAALKARAESLALGLGDVSVANAELARSATPVAAAMEAIVIEGDSVTASLVRQASQALITSRAFDQISEAMGRAAAVQAALAAGGVLTSGGTRVQLPGGGSRLTSPAGFGSGPSRFFPGLTTYR